MAFHVGPTDGFIGTSRTVIAVGMPSGPRRLDGFLSAAQNPVFEGSGLELRHKYNTLNASCVLIHPSIAIEYAVRLQDPKRMAHPLREAARSCVARVVHEVRARWDPAMEPTRTGI
jgi:hypothetical protein